jgi:superfamily I DNA/RNA helicase
VTVFAVEGVAGSGKTWRLMEALSESLRVRPLRKPQSVLALTFMHGARRRLEERLSVVAELNLQYKCTTVDSFAWQLNKRWRSLVVHLNMSEPADDDFEGTCELAGLLLEQPSVSSWVAASHPIVLVDEAQDLRLPRLRIIKALSAAADLFVAADEFQCLDGELRLNPAIAWLPSVCNIESLSGCRRTSADGLLSAAQALREGRRLETRGTFRINSVASPPMAAAYLANAIAWGGAGRAAIITPSLQGNFARRAVALVCGGPCGRQGNGPYAIHWERSSRIEANDLSQLLEIDEQCEYHDARSAIARLPACGPTRHAEQWLYRQRHALGRVMFTREELVAILERGVEIRANISSIKHKFLAMTVQQAKNREFDGVVVIWPYQVGGDAEHKRRLLYNAVTRAIAWCAVLVQGSQLPTGSPFN